MCRSGSDDDDAALASERAAPDRGDGFEWQLLRLIEESAHPVLAVDLQSPGFPVVAASRGYGALTGCAAAEAVGASVEQLLSRGAPHYAVSKSANKNLSSYCSACCEPGVEDISETTVMQPCAAAGGSVAILLSLLGLCKVGGRRLVLVVQGSQAESLGVRVPPAKIRESEESLRGAFRGLRARLKERAGEPEAVFDSDRAAPETAEASAKTSAASTWPAFYQHRLQDHCVLSNGGSTASRREPNELHSGCLVFSRRPVPASAEHGLRLSVRVEAVADGFDGLPLLGFTRRRPDDVPELYPAVASCLGQSVLIGREGKAFARDQRDHFQMGFKLPPAHEVETWTPPQGQVLPKLRQGDIVTCVYTRDGRLKLVLNGYTVLDFDVGRPIQPGVDYYAVVDVCFTASSLTWLPQAALHARVSASHWTSDGTLSTIEPDDESVLLCTAASSSCSSLPSISDTPLSRLDEVSLDEASQDTGAADILVYSDEEEHGHVPFTADVRPEVHVDAGEAESTCVTTSQRRRDGGTAAAAAAAAAVACAAVAASGLLLRRRLGRP